MTIKYISQSTNLLHMYVHDVQGGQELSIALSSELVDCIQWVTKYRASLEKEQELRVNTPALENLYQEYITMRNLVSSDSKLET